MSSVLNLQYFQKVPSFRRLGITLFWSLNFFAFFFCSAVIFSHFYIDLSFISSCAPISVLLHLSIRKQSLKASDSQDAERKRDLRKGGFLNLIKSRSGKDKEKDKDKEKEKEKDKEKASTSAPPLSPVPQAAEEPLSPKAKSQSLRSERSSSSERSEELKTPDYGVQVMGSGLLAEMKAKQEKRAKVCLRYSAVSGPTKSSIMLHIIIT